MKAKVVLKNLGKLSPVMLLIVTYVLPLTMTVLADVLGMDVNSSTLFVSPIGIIIWPLLFLAIGLSFWHLIQRRRIAESMLALLLALPMMLICVGTVSQAMADRQLL